MSQISKCPKLRAVLGYWEALGEVSELRYKNLLYSSSKRSYCRPGFDDAFAEWENARLWCFPGEPKAALNLLPISIRWEESQPFSNRIFSPLFLDSCAFSNVILVKLFWYHKLSSSMERLMKVWGEGTLLHFVLTGKWISLCWFMEDIYLEVANVLILWLQVCKVASALAQSRNRRESDSQHWGCFW